MQKLLQACTSIDYTGADLDSPLVMIKMNITHIKYQDNCFDVIICKHVLEDLLAMRELYCVLKPGAGVICREQFQK